MRLQLTVKEVFKQLHAADAQPLTQNAANKKKHQKNQKSTIKKEKKQKEKEEKNEKKKEDCYRSKAQPELSGSVDLTFLSPPRAQQKDNTQYTQPQPEDQDADDEDEGLWLHTDQNARCKGSGEWPMWQSILYVYPKPGTGGYHWERIAQGICYAPVAQRAAHAQRRLLGMCITGQPSTHWPQLAEYHGHGYHKCPRLQRIKPQLLKSDETVAVFQQELLKEQMEYPARPRLLQRCSVQELGRLLDQDRLIYLGCGGSDNNEEVASSSNRSSEFTGEWHKDGRGKEALLVRPMLSIASTNPLVCSGVLEVLYKPDRGESRSEVVTHTLKHMDGPDQLHVTWKCSTTSWFVAEGNSLQEWYAGDLSARLVCNDGL
jgi:hypothetical protein